MKKLFAVLVSVFLFSANVHAQVVVEFGALAQALMEGTKLEQFIYYAQMVQQQTQAAVNSYNQFEAMIRAEQRALDNLQGITSVDSYGDFMNWYNRQLYLERQTEYLYQDMGIKIGDNTYSLADIDKIPDAMRSRFTDDQYWDDFTEEQRREMWMNLGLTPANYVYQTAWAEREKELAREIMTRRQMINEENAAAFQKNRDLLDRAYAADLGEKGLLQILVEMTADLNRAVREANYDAAEWREHQLSESRLGNTPQSRPGPSDIWGMELFEPISELEGEFIDKY